MSDTSVSGEWQPIRTAPEGVAVETAIIDADGQRNTQVMLRAGAVWMFPDDGFRVYYQPTHWRPVAGSGAQRNTPA